MRISINIPTYKRAKMCDTFKILPKATYWVHEFEVEEYEKSNPKMKIGVLPDKIKGNIARVRNYIIEETLPGNSGTILIDDDVKRIGYHEDTERYYLEPEEIPEMIDNYSELCKEWGLYMWGIQVNPDPQCYREYTPFSTLSYISGSFCCFLQGFEPRHDERFSLKEDYDISLQAINQYRGILRVNKYFYEKKGAEQIGGCAQYRNIDKEVGQIKALQAKWGKSIVKMDAGKSRSHSTKKEKAKADINPIIKVPIKGV